MRTKWKVKNEVRNSKRARGKMAGEWVTRAETRTILEARPPGIPGDMNWVRGGRYRKVGGMVLEPQRKCWLGYRHCPCKERGGEITRAHLATVSLVSLQGFLLALEPLCGFRICPCYRSRKELGMDLRANKQMTGPLPSLYSKQLILPLESMMKGDFYLLWGIQWQAFVLLLFFLFSRSGGIF